MATITRGTFVAALSARLSDPNNTYWSLPELRLYLAEALHTWQALTSWYRTNVPLTITPGWPWYDLSASSAPLPYTTTDAALISQLLYALLEPQLGGGYSWAGTQQFDLSTIVSAVQNAVNRFLGDSGVVSTLLYSSVSASAVVSVDPNIIDILRVAWKVSGSTAWGMLWKSSEWELHAFSTAGATAPVVYAASSTPPATLRLAPAPAAGGSLEIAGVVGIPPLNLPASATVLGIPEDYLWGVKWAALSELLSKEAEGKDVQRAAYAETRYQESVELAKAFPSVLQLFVGGQPVWVGSVYDLDTFQPGWENLSSSVGPPQSAGMLGRNLLALSPPPSNSTAVTLDLVANIPIPANDSDLLQIPPDAVGVLSDYAMHLASFKMGGSEFEATEDLRKDFYRAAAEYNQRLRQMNFYNDALRSPALTQRAEQPRIETPLLTSYAPAKVNQ